MALRDQAGRLPSSRGEVRQRGDALLAQQKALGEFLPKRRAHHGGYSTAKMFALSLCKLGALRV